MTSFIKKIIKKDIDGLFAYNWTMKTGHIKRKYTIHLCFRFSGLLFCVLITNLIVCVTRLFLHRIQGTVYLLLMLHGKPVKWAVFRMTTLGVTSFVWRRPRFTRWSRVALCCKLKHRVKHFVGINVDSSVKPSGFFTCCVMFNPVHNFACVSCHTNMYIIMVVCVGGSVLLLMISRTQFCSLSSLWLLAEGSDLLYVHKDQVALFTEWRLCVRVITVVTSHQWLWLCEHFFLWSNLHVCGNGRVRSI